MGGFWSSLLAGAAGGTQTANTLLRQKQEDEMSMYGHGLQPVDPNAPTPVTALPSTGQVNANIAQQVGHGTDTPLTAPGTPISQGTLVHLMGRDWIMTPQAQAQMQIGMALKQAEMQAKMAEAQKNLHEARRLQPGDPNYNASEAERAGMVANAEVAPAGAKAGAIATATLPIDVAKLRAQLKNAIAEINARGGVEAGLQGSRQTFEQGQAERAHTAAASLQTARQEGEFANKVGEEGVKQSASPVAKITRAATGAPDLPMTGAGGANPLHALPPLTVPQRVRAATDPDYAAFLKAKGYK